MSQSTNARPCNCDQALRAEAEIADLKTNLEVSQEDEREWYKMYRESADREAAAVYARDVALEVESANREVLNTANARADKFKAALSKEETEHLATCAELDEANATIKTICRILCDLVSAPSLSVAQFADPTLERIRLAMLGRER